MAADKWRLPLLQHERFEFMEPTEEGIEHIAANLRPGDQEEAFATFGHRHYLHGIRLSIAASDDVVMAVSAYSEPIALIGVSTLSFLYNVGCPWMLATPKVDAYRRAFIEFSGSYTQEMLKEYRVLQNHVDARNTRSVAWLQRIGFSIEDAEPFGELGLPFHPFRIERSSHV